MSSDSTERPGTSQPAPGGLPSDPAQSGEPGPVQDMPPADAPAPLSASDSAAGAPPLEGPPAEPSKPKRRILIGSQRDPAAYRPRPDLSFVERKEKKSKSRRDKRHGMAGPRKPEAHGVTPEESASASSPPAAEPSLPAAEPSPPAAEPSLPSAEAQPVVVAPAPAPPPVIAETPSPGAEAQPAGDAVLPPPPPASVVAEAKPASAFDLHEDDEELDQQIAALDTSDLAVGPTPGAPGKRFPPPNLRGQLPPDLEQEYQQAVADASLDELIDEGEAVTKAGLLEPESLHTARVLGIHRDNVFVELGSREQGVVPLKLFVEPPEAGAAVEVRVTRFKPDEGLYELVLPSSAADVADWADLSEGITVQARITGHNSGGLECEVNRIRGFIPISQIALYRVENLEEFVGQTMPCLVTEANPDRRNLVLSRRALLEREREQARQALWETLTPGQVREGVVRKLLDFGAFIDLGGVDGLLHVSQLAWGRVKHPSEVLQEGQTIKVRIDKINAETRRISLSYRELVQQDPWVGVDKKFPVNTPVHGKVTRLADFGAFVELEPGVEGLVHISELSHKRVWRVSDVVKEDDEVDVMVLSVDVEAKRIGLSMKHLLPPPEPVKKEAASEPEEPTPARKTPNKPSQPLQGGLGRAPGGQRFGLKW